MTDFLPNEAKKHQKIVQKIRSVFEKYSYKKIKTPTIEYLDSLAVGLGETLQSEAIKVFDPAGHVLVLRPDHTTPIARIAATRLRDEPLPLRLYYLDPIFRNRPGSHEDDIELFQAGIELIGDVSPKATAEVLIVCIDSIQKLGYRDFKIDIGHTDFAKGLSSEKKKALLEGNYLSGIPKRGGVELVKGHTDLVEVYNLLKKAKCEKFIEFNLGLVKDLNYYTGMIMECYVQGFRRSIGSGGQYNNLLGKFGMDCPAVGFALNVNALL